MNKTNILGFIINIQLLLCSNIFAQEINNNTKVKKDTVIPHISFKKGIRIGVDVFKPILSFFKEDQKRIEFISDLNIYENWFLSGSLGYEKASFKNEIISSTGEGSFLTFGFRYNFLRRKKGDNNIFYIGGHYGISIFKQSISHIILDKRTKLTYKENIPNKDYKPNWAGFSFGMEVELIPYIFFGWEASVSSVLVGRYQDNIDAIYIPGMGEHNEGTDYKFTYHISIFLPFFVN